MQFLQEINDINTEDYHYLSEMYPDDKSLQLYMGQKLVDKIKYCKSNNFDIRLNLKSIIKFLGYREVGFDLMRLMAL